jgi:hypothetical protein
MKRMVLIACAVLAACNAKHDSTKQMELLRDCIRAHTGLPAGTTGDLDINLNGGVIRYCEDFADQNSLVQTK